MNTTRTAEEQLLIKLDKFRKLERTQKKVITSLSSQLEFYKHRTFELEVTTASLQALQAQQGHQQPEVVNTAANTSIEYQTKVLEIKSLREQLERLVACLATVTNLDEEAIVDQLKNNEIKEVISDSYGVRFA